MVAAVALVPALQQRARPRQLRLLRLERLQSRVALQPREFREQLSVLTLVPQAAGQPLAPRRWSSRRAARTQAAPARPAELPSLRVQPAAVVARNTPRKQATLRQSSRPPSATSRAIRTWFAFSSLLLHSADVSDRAVCIRLRPRHQIASTIAEIPCARSNSCDADVKSCRKNRQFLLFTAQGLGLHPRPAESA